MTQQARIVMVVALGGVLGALARYGIGVAFPPTAHGFPWATFTINVTGCFLIGVLMVIVTDGIPNQVYARPFLGVGVLGGYTTFSTYEVDVVRLAAGDAGGTAVVYVFATVAAAITAVYLAISVTRWALFRATIDEGPAA